ncbi:metallo-dependent phosphatase [Stemphylium lycopersici]|uniref:Metallo-dependent phosphatase n=1 Tax=Stemphylium lycopersici TaxID=183478 RepID=A0A364NC70_STELY|nr:metallo-dependent phosphatase [Stemphylium lycopersici]
MEDSRNSGSHASRALNPTLVKAPDSSAQRRTSYRRPADAQPAGASPPESAMSNAMPSNIARPVSTASSNGSGSRRRNSKIILPPTTGAMNEPVPAAPEVPRAPPSSYRDPYARGTKVPARTTSARSRDPAIQLNPSRQQATIQTAADRLYNLRSPPYAPVEPLAGAVGRRPSQRGGPSVPDRSPLQKLEGKLDDISKEERRARMLEAELAAQEKAEAEMRERRAREAAREAAQKQQRVVSHPVPTSEKNSGASNQASSSKRHVSMPTENKHMSPRSQISEGESDDGYAHDFPEPWNPTASEGGAVQPAQQATRQKGKAIPVEYQQVPHTDGAVARTTSRKGKEPVRSSPRGGSYSDRSALPSQRDHKPDANTAGLGLVGVAGTSAGSDFARPTRIQGRRDSRGIMAAQMEMQQDSIDQKGAPRVVDIPPTKPRIPPVPKTTPVIMPPVPQTNRKSVVFSESESELDQHDPEKKQRHRRSRHHDEPERTYTPGPELDEWRSAPVGILAAEDLDLNAPVTANSGNKAWWEETKLARRRRPSSYAEPTYDGYADDTHTPTAFNPALYLKCGPLLRYTGLRKDRSKPGQEREIWRGSVMIVTVDASSSYAKPPTLRLFKQPMDILPPPPAEVDQDQLDPSYVDPIEGQVKVSRTGKTLYVKPIDELAEDEDLSRVEDDTGLFSRTRSTTNGTAAKSTRIHKRDGEKLGKVRDFPGVRLYAERGVTFWRFNIEVELGTTQARIAYKINQGPAIGFWVPAKGESMNIMFHSCNGFSASVEPDGFCGPDPLWRDVLNTHQTRPFHVMIGGGDQIYNDAAMHQTTLFRQWTESRNPMHKHHQPFSEEMQNELEQFYLDRYSMWFSQGLFGMANSQIPMVNMWDDHDIIDGFGSYPHHFMQTPVFTGVGAVAFKYYMLFQHQSVAAETEKTEPSWLLGKSPGPYIKERSRSVFMQLGRQVAFLGLDCRTERQRDEILTEDSYDIIFDRLEDEIIKGETKHLIVLLGVPIAYPRLNFLENILTSRLMDPLKALGRAGLLGNFVNKFDGGVEILDDLDDHWTAKHHKEERNWFIKELQHIASTKSVRVTILGGDVHLAAVGQFYSNKKLNVPKDKDHRYMPNVVSSAIVNTPPPDIMADIINKRNKVHHLDSETDEDMIPLFTHGVDGKKRNNNHLLPHRNWCSIREYKPGFTPSGSPSPPATPDNTGRSFAPGQLVRRLSGQTRPSARSRGPPVSYRNNPAYAAADDQQVGHHQPQSSFSPDRSEPERPARSRRNSLSSLFRRRASVDGARPDTSESATPPRSRRSESQDRPTTFHRRPSVLSKKNPKQDEYINLEGGLDICLNVEVSQHDPAGITTPYRLLVPALDYTEPEAGIGEKEPHKRGFFGAFGGRRKATIGDDGDSISSSDSGSELGEISSEDERRLQEQYRVGPRVAPGPAVASPPIAGSAPAPLIGPTPAPVVRENLLSSGFHANTARTVGPAQSDGAVNRPIPQNQGGRRSMDAPAGASSRASAWENVAGRRHVSAPQHPAIVQNTPPTAVLPSRSPSTRRQPSYSNSSHKSQLPTANPAEDVSMKRRSMSGAAGQNAYNLAPTLSQKRSKRESYPPHPAIVGAGPGSPYTRDGQGLQARQDTAGGDYFSSGGRDGQSHPAMAPRQVVDPEYTEKPVQRADYAAQPQRGGYDRTSSYPTYPQRNGSAGGGARYLGGGGYEDGEDSFDSADEEEPGFSPQGEEMSQESFVVPKPKKKWQIWR